MNQIDHVVNFYKSLAMKPKKVWVESTANRTCQNRYEINKKAEDEIRKAEEVKVKDKTTDFYLNLGKQ